MNDLDREINGRPLKIAMFDIEATGLKADFGYLLCVSILDARTEKIKTIRIDDKRNPNKFSDKWVVKEAIKELDKYDLLVGWYSSRYDHPFIDTRALHHGLKVQDRNLRRDLWATSRCRLVMRSNRLAVAGELLFGKTIKDAIYPEVWHKAQRNDRKALNYIVNHCEKDVRETLRVYLKFMPLFPNRLRRN